MYKKNISLIGIGYWGKVHLKYLKKIKNLNLKYIVFKKNKKHFKNKLLSNYNLINDLKIILKDKEITHVDLVTPINTHASLLINCLKHHKRVLVEKPLIMNNNEEKILNKYSNNFNVSYPYLYSKTLTEAKKIVEKRRLGKLKFIEIVIKQCGRFNKYNVYELLAPHAISIFSKFFGIKNLNFKKKTLIKNNSKPESAIIECYNKNKLISLINLSLNYGSNTQEKKVIIYCENGNLFCDLKKKENNLIGYIYQRKKSYSSIKVKKIIEKTFNEQDNIYEVIKNFFLKKETMNFKLTKIINKVLKTK